MPTYSIEVTDAPDTLDLVEALKSHLRLNNGDAEDTELARFVSAAASIFEHQTNRVLLPTGYRQHFTGWNWSEPLELARAKVTAVSAVKYYDSEDTLVTLSAFNVSTAPGGYRTDLTGVPALVYLPERAAPALSTYRQRPVYVEFTAGEWASGDYLPDDLYLAILLYAGHLYEVRESHTTDDYKVTDGFKRVCDKYQTGLGGV